MLKKALVLVLCLSTLFSAGCWDKIEIEKRAFVLGIAIDKAEDEDEVLVTFQIALPQAFGEQGSDAESYWNISQTASDITGARRRLHKSINWIPTFEHCQVLLIGEELAREGISQYVDFFFRTYDIRRRMEVAVVSGTAKDVFDVEVKSEPVPAFFISELMRQNSEYSFEVADYNYIGRLHEDYILDSEFVISRVLYGDVIDVSGAGVFKNFRLVGWLSGEELAAARMLRGDVRSGILGVEVPAVYGERIMLRVFDISTNLKPEFRDGQIVAVSRIRLEGDIEEIRRPGTDIEDAQAIREMEQHIQEYVEGNIRRVFNKVQKQFESDPFRFDEQVMNNHPNFWHDNKNNWDVIYQTVDLDVEVEVRIRRIGEINY